MRDALPKKKNTHKCVLKPKLKWFLFYLLFLFTPFNSPRALMTAKCQWS